MYIAEATRFRLPCPSEEDNAIRALEEGDLEGKQLPD
jgi:hypothetical protein